MQLSINGQVVALPAPITLAQWLAQTGFTGQRIACELNRELVPRSQWTQTLLSDGDTLEIVAAIGGG